VDGKFHTEKAGPAFELSVRITDVNMPAMNDMFRAYGKFDVASGEFSFFSEMAVRERGYHRLVKPLFKDITIYDAEKDKDKTFTHKMYERVWEGGQAPQKSALAKRSPRKRYLRAAGQSQRETLGSHHPPGPERLLQSHSPGLERETKRERA